MSDRKVKGGRVLAVVVGRRHADGWVELTVRSAGPHAERLFRDRPHEILASWGWCAEPEAQAQGRPRWRCGVCGRTDAAGRCCTLGNRRPANAAARLEYETGGAL